MRIAKLAKITVNDVGQLDWDGTTRDDYIPSLIHELRQLPDETPYVEFKVNSAEPESIGEYVSALSNAAALHNQAHGFVIWGVSNDTHEVVGTTFRPSRAKKGNEDLENWLVRLLNPRLHIHFFEASVSGKAVVVLQIPRAHARPTQFQATEFVRIGSHRQKLKDYPEVERDLWRTFEHTPFEELRSIERLRPEDVLDLLNYEAYFQFLGIPPPGTPDRLLEALSTDDLVARNSAGGWDVTNLGAILFARSLQAFKSVRRKAVRIIRYEGRDRLKTRNEHVVASGYAVGFSTLVELITDFVPRNEVIRKALRRESPMYPELAIRELAANALVHQDLAVMGAGPMVEIFQDRLEISNPGSPLVRPDRFLDSPPRSRNEALASFMRRIGVCEERGSGIDKVVAETEAYQLPAPLFENPNGSTRTILFAHRPFRGMDKADRVRACYLHACLRHVMHDPMTNGSLRDRFGIEERNAASASRIIGDTMSEGLIKPYDPDQGRRFAKYVPFWA